MINRLILIAVIGGVVALLYGVTMLSVPSRGFTKLLEHLASGIILCFICYVILSPLGIPVLQTPFAVLCAGGLGLPGVVLSAFLTLWP